MDRELSSKFEWNLPPDGSHPSASPGFACYWRQPVPLRDGCHQRFFAARQNIFANRAENIFQSMAVGIGVGT